MRKNNTVHFSLSEHFALKMNYRDRRRAISSVRFAVFGVCHTLLARDCSTGHIFRPILMKREPRLSEEYPRKVRIWVTCVLKLGHQVTNITIQESKCTTLNLIRMLTGQYIG